MHYAVDTNVLVVANGMSEQADLACQDAAIAGLLAVRENEALLLDTQGVVIDEYSRHCSFSGQPGVGDEFFLWAFNNQHELGRIPLEPHEGRRFREFPADPALTGFDWDDRPFVALVAAWPGDAAVVNCVDSDYENDREALTANDIEVRELCPHRLPPNP